MKKLGDTIKTLEYGASVDDYEHDGDIQNEVDKWRKVGAYGIEVEKPYDNDPWIKMKFDINDTKAERIIDIAIASYPDQTARIQDYSTTVYYWDVQYLFQTFAKEFGVDYNEIFKDKMTKLNDLL